MQLLALREPAQSGAVESIDGPIGHGLRAEPLIEADCERVPIQHGPLDARAVPLDGERSEPPWVRLERPSADPRARLLTRERIERSEINPAVPITALRFSVGPFRFIGTTG